MIDFSQGDETHTCLPQKVNLQQTRVGTAPKFSLMTQWLLLRLLIGAWYF